jgi:hypothetical protein
VVGSCRRPDTCIWCWGLECVEFYLHLTITPFILNFVCCPKLPTFGLDLRLVGVCVWRGEGAAGSVGGCWNVTSWRLASRTGQLYYSHSQAPRLSWNGDMQVGKYRVDLVKVRSISLHVCCNWTQSVYDLPQIPFGFDVHNSQLCWTPFCIFSN